MLGPPRSRPGARTVKILRTISMNKEEALALLEQELSAYRDMSYGDLASRVGTGPFVCERVAPTGAAYQIEIDLMLDHRDGNLYVLGSIDDGGWWSSFRPVTCDFIKTPDGSFVGE
jgi:hypothetical protein